MICDIGFATLACDIGLRHLACKTGAATQPGGGERDLAPGDHKLQRKNQNVA
jgi:hypothetical protein